jgi:hypothetical protein
MKRLPVIAWLAAMAALTFSPQAEAQSRATQNRATYEKLVATHAKANHVPEGLVHRVIVRESKYQPDLIGHGGTIGLMQIKLPTARGLGYQGDADGLRDPDTNLTYGTKYLAGAWRAAEGDHDRAVRLYASGYYHIAKRQRLERLKHPEPVLASAPPQEPVQANEASAEPKQAVVEPKDAAAPAEPVEKAKPVATAPPKEADTPKQAGGPKQAVARQTAASTSTPAPAKPKGAAKPLPGPLVLTPILAKLKAALTPSAKPAPKKLAEARDRVPRPTSAVSSGANAAKPR